MWVRLPPEPPYFASLNYRKNKKNPNMNRDKIVQFCEEYLKVKDFEDYCVNGLQVEGKAEVKKIVAGVSLSQKLLKAAIAKKADMVLVHHGIFKDQLGAVPAIKGSLRNRLALILKNDINLCGFHLPLDAHPEIGNNISLCKLLGLRKIKPFDIGFVGELEKGIEFDRFVRIVDSKIGTKSYAIQAGAKKVKKIGIVSGGASKYYAGAAGMGADTFICGDIVERVVSEVEEMEMNFINAGHYNTEKLGIQNLARLLAKKFKISAEFVDIPNEI
jgi:dinuclear metal center YbgI/SA1388 family protein